MRRNGVQTVIVQSAKNPNAAYLHGVKKLKWRPSNRMSASALIATVKADMPDFRFVPGRDIKNTDDPCGIRLRDGPIWSACDILHEEETRKDRHRTVEAPEHNKAHPLVEWTGLEGVGVRPHMPAPASDGFLFSLS